MKGGAKRAFVLGPTCDPELSAVGISTIEQVRAIGWEEAAARWIEGFPARANVNAVVGLMALDLGVHFRDLSPQDRERARGFVARHKTPSARKAPRL